MKGFYQLPQSEYVAIISLVNSWNYLFFVSMNLYNHTFIFLESVYVRNNMFRNALQFLNLFRNINSYLEFGLKLDMESIITDTIFWTPTIYASYILSYGSLNSILCSKH